MKNILYPIVVVLLLSMLSCKNGQPSQGDKTIKVFEEAIVHFSDSLATLDTNTIYLTQGRIILKKVDIPVYQKQVDASIRLRLQSNGDSWDKSGSVFVFDKSAALNMLNISDSMPLPVYDSLPYPGILCADNYKPTVELMRFMTPFGVGFFSEKVKRKPVYIPKFENEVVWEQDVTDRLSFLEGETWIGVWIDTWTKEGYKISLDLILDETEAIDYPKPKSHIAPVVNTVAYSGQKLPDFFAYQDLKTTFNLPQGAKNVQLKYIVTGHGGHSGGDEFTEQVHNISVDGKEVLSFTPWRDDCASFRRFNPTSGVWLVEDTASYIDEELGRYNQKVIEERIASSDLSRSNWCPGSDVPPINIPLPDIKAGTHTLTISIPHAQAAEDNKLNHWLISSYIYWEE